MKGLDDVMVHAWAGKEFSDIRQNEKRIKFIRERERQNSIRIVGWFKGEPNTSAGLQPIFTASRKKIPTGMVSLGVRKLAGLGLEAHGNRCYGAWSVPEIFILGFWYRASHL